MTHDELLILVTGGTDYTMAEEHLLYRKAFRAVVELHKPEHSILGYCCNLDDEHYPCRTIQAIEKELS